MDEWKTEAVKRLSAFEIFLVLLGVLSIALAAAHGITYQGWLPIESINGRITLEVTGAVLIALGVIVRIASPKHGVPSIKDLNVQIIHPENGDEVTERVDVRGTFAKGALPKGYSIRVLRGYTDGGFQPSAETAVDSENGTWQALDHQVGGDPGDRRLIQVWLIGEGGAAMLACWAEAAAVHWELQKEFKKQLHYYAHWLWLNPIKVQTRDMILCKSILVRRKI